MNGLTVPGASDPRFSPAPDSGDLDHRQVGRYFQIINERNMEALGEVFAEHSSIVGGNDGPWSTGVAGLEQLKAGAEEFLEEHPTWRIVIDNIIGEGDKVAVRWTGFEEGKPTRVAVVMFRVSDGKIVNDWYCGRRLDE